MAEFVITTDPESQSVEIAADNDAEFVDWMMACEFFIQKTAQKSSAGYEGAMELLCEGSLGYKGMLI